MPYLKQEQRGWIDYQLADVTEDKSLTPGEVNYMLAKIANAFLGEAPNYERFNALIGAFECAKLELYRRRVAPYEDGKAAVNGDVFPSSADEEARARKT